MHHIEKNSATDQLMKRIFIDEITSHTLEFEYVMDDIQHEKLLLWTFLMGVMPWTTYLIEGIL
jgi:hypothetical protein